MSNPYTGTSMSWEKFLLPVIIHKLCCLMVLNNAVLARVWTFSVWAYSLTKVAVMASAVCNFVRNIFCETPPLSSFTKHGYLVSYYWPSLLQSSCNRSLAMFFLTV